MRIETKFSVGDVVYVCRNDSTYEKGPCKICEGIGVISIKAETFSCPKCHGNKFICTKRVNKFTPEKRTIRKVIVSVSENNGTMQTYIRYETKTHGNRDRSVADYKNIMFYAKEEAEYRCKELNGEIIKIPNALIVKDYADKIKVNPAEIIKWLFLRGKTVSNNSEICFEDMKEFASKYRFICEKEVEV